jgi:hypothetical protein
MHDEGRREEVLKDISDEMGRQSGEPITDDDTLMTPPT